MQTTAQLAATRDAAFATEGKAFDQYEIGAHAVNDIADFYFVGRLRQHEAAGATAHRS
jgi:hypothetical protein